MIEGLINLFSDPIGHFGLSRWLAVLPFGPFFPDFGPDPDFFEEIGPEMVRIYTKKSGFD